tara:strand:- start:189 stop:356 length:168 start_codon:yes stop_codon:yes gene_type:complete
MDNYFPDKTRKQVETCPRCNGYGWVGDTTLQGYYYCDTCDRTGEVTTKEDTKEDK